MDGASRSFFTLGVIVFAGSSTAAGCSCGSNPEILTSGPSSTTGTSTNAGGAGGTGAGTGGSIFTSSGGGGAGGAGAAAGAGGAAGGGGTGGDPCIYVPPPGQFAPQLDCAWNGPSAAAPYQGYDDVVMTPVVVNLTDDDMSGAVDLGDVPDIAFITYRLQEDGCCNQNGVLRVLSGACAAGGTMTEHFSVGATEIEAATGTPGIWLDNSGGLAAGDVDADGSVDLVATLVGGGTIAFEKDGGVKWVNAMHPSAAAHDHLAGTAPSLADLDADGMPEVISGRVVLNGEDGSLAWQGAAGTGTNAFLGPVSAVGDVDLDGKLNVLAGNTLYDDAGTPLWTFAFPIPITPASCGAPAGYTCDGFTATGNFDADDQGEIVIIVAGDIYVLNHDGTLLDVGGTPAHIVIPKDNCPRNEGGPPTVADFDGDGQAEIGVAAGDYYAVADLECLAVPLPAFCSDPGIRWKVANQDCSSRATGSSVFDFDGDGKAEVVYNDELLFRVFDGTTGATLISTDNHSHTRLEMPIVADVDNDGNAEIVFIENGFGGLTQGVRVWGDAGDSWVPTRRIWNQHSYHVTNVSELGAIPQIEPVNWLEPTNATASGKMNNFRQNLPDFDVFAAPDLTVDLTIDKTNCPNFLGLAAKVCNAGALVVGAGANVTFWDNSTLTQIACANVTKTTMSLDPGECETVTCNWLGAPLDPSPVDVRACVDNAGYDCATRLPSGGNNECHEDNNKSDEQGTGCTDVPS